MFSLFNYPLRKLKPVLPCGVLQQWDDLDPRLYHGVHIYWLKFYGMWYINFESDNLMYWVKLLYGVMVFFLVCLLPGAGEIVYLFRRSDSIANVAEGLYLFLSEMFTYVKLFVFWRNKENVLTLLKFLKCAEFEPKEQEHRVILKESIKTSRFVMTYYSTMCVGAVSVGIIMPLTENFEVLPTNVEYPYLDVYKSPAYELLYLHHIYYKPATCIIDGVMDTILASFITSAIGQIEILQHNLRNFDVLASKLRLTSLNGKLYDKEESYRVILKDCIKHHNSIIQYVSLIEESFSFASAMQFMLSAMVLCLVGVQFLSIENPSQHLMQISWMGIYLTCMLIEVFILCWFGNQLIWKSEEIRQAAFDGPWMKTNPKTRKYIILIMERCKQPLIVSAGKICTVSLASYTVLINWSYKAFAVMMNMNK